MINTNSNYSVANMASAGKKPPDTALTKFYKNHPQTKVEAVLCIMCQNFFHPNEIVTKYNSGCPVKFINKTLTICQDHLNVALTSNILYGELTINLDKLNNKQKDLNDTIYEDYSEIEILKIENQLLKQLNNELQDKNKILNELLKKNRTKTTTEIAVKPKPKSKST